MSTKFGTILKRYRLQYLFWWKYQYALKTTLYCQLLNPSRRTKSIIITGCNLTWPKARLQQQLNNHQPEPTKVGNAMGAAKIVLQLRNANQYFERTLKILAWELALLLYS
jgi:hypothetical protein